MPGYRDSLPPQSLAMLDHIRQVSAIGTPRMVAEGLARFQQRTRADELIVSGATFDPAMRRRSLALTMDAVRELV